MNRKNYYPVLILLLTLTISCASSKDNRSSLVLIKTTLGDIKIKLYDGTPLHRENFIRLVNSQVYDGISFHRVIKDFMIQAGDPMTKPGYVSNSNDTLVSYTIPAEFNRAYFHKKGALAAARQGNEVNPEMRSSGTQFYIVQGTRYTDDQLNQVERQINNNLKQALFIKFLKEISDSTKKAGVPLTDAQIQEKASVRMFETFAAQGDYKIPEEQRTVYKTIGGTPRLDCTYTVFGEVVEGLDVVDKIASVPTNESDRPINDVRIIKMKMVSK